MKKKIPRFETDEQAAEFLETADLSEYDLSGFAPARFEFDRKSAQVNVRVPKALLDAVKDRAKARGIPYTRYIRQLMERDIARR
jgi:predicted DNA binding CopG/RHH family protein